jgi:predicted RNA binding protein YcfA (HicA-like mRNA interferase family)
MVGQRRLPALRPREVIRVLERNGFSVRRQTGSHVQLYHRTDPRRFATVPYHNKDLTIKTLRNIIVRAGWTVEEFLDLL